MEPKTLKIQRIIWCKICSALMLCTMLLSLFFTIPAAAQTLGESQFANIPQLITISTSLNPAGARKYSAGTWKIKNGKYYYLQKNGKNVTGWAIIGGKTYYFRKNGALHSGWLKYQNKPFYFDTESPKPSMVTGLRKVNNKWYYFSQKGNAKKGFFTVTEKGKAYTCYGKDDYSLATSQWLIRKGKHMYAGYNGKITLKKNVTHTSEEYKKIFMIGDSRFFRTQKNGITSSNTVFIAQPGEGLDWLKSTAFPQLKARLQSLSQHTTAKSAIVLNLGVNDLDNVYEYIDYLARKLIPLASKYNCDLYYVSVNPVCEAKYNLCSHNKKTKTMPQILSFNQTLKQYLPSSIHYIDTCTYLMTHYTFEEITLEDGVHYTHPTSGRIFDKILQSCTPS